MLRPFPLCWVLRVFSGFGRALLCSFAGCRCSAPAPGAAALAGVLSFASVSGWFGVFASSWIWDALCTFGPVCLLGSCWFFATAWGCGPRFGGAQIGHGVCCWLHPFPMRWVSWSFFFILGFERVFVRWWPCSVPGSSWCLGLLRDILCCSFAGCRCLASAPGAAALAGLLSFASVYGHLGVFASSWIWGALCALRPRLFVVSCWFSRCGLGVMTLSWVWCAIGLGVPFPMCWVSGVFPSSWVLGEPLFAGGSVLFGFQRLSRSLAGYTLLPFVGCRCLAPAPGAAALAGLLSFASVYGHLGVCCFFLPCALLAPSVCLVLAVFCHWHPFPVCWVLRAFSSSCVLGVPSFVGGPVHDLGSCWFLGR